MNKSLETTVPFESMKESMESNACLILTMAACMFAVTFMVGYLPTKLTASARVMQLISLFGAGLLVGAALIVIVPEGISVLYESMESETDIKNKKEITNRYCGASLIFGFIVMLLIDQGF